MMTCRLWPSTLAALVVFAIGGGAALGQPVPITACGTTITVRGSYVVTRNITATSTSVPCIRVMAPAVTIDLGGFVLTGIGGSPAIVATFGSTGLTVANGFIRSFNFGINAQTPRVKLRNVTLVGNQGDGAILGPGAEVTDSKFLNNTGNGLRATNFVLVLHCTFVGNRANGLLAAGGNAALTENVASSNGSGVVTLGAGFVTNGNALVTGNVARGNTSRSAAIDGFNDPVGASTFEGNSGSSNGGQGFGMGDQSVNSHQILGANVFIGNSAVGNALTGFVDAGGSTFEANTSDNNLAGFSTDAAGSTFVTNTADINSSTSFSAGFDVFCPANLVGNTAEDNTTAFTSQGSGCAFNVNLGF